MLDLGDGMRLNKRPVSLLCRGGREAQVARLGLTASLAQRDYANKTKVGPFEC